MAKVLKAANVATDISYVDKTLGADADEVWVTLDVAFEAAALTLWTSDPGGTTFSGYFLTLFSAIGGGGDHQVEVVWIDGAGPGTEWGVASGAGGTTGSATSPVPVAATWQTLELHYLRNTSVDVYIDTVLIASGVAPNEPIHRFSVGQDQEAPLDPAAFAYIDNVKLGTTRGASDLFADDFEGGDLSAWSTSVGEVSVVNYPEVTPVPHVLKASNFSTDTSYVSKSLGGDEDEVWVSLDVAYEASALALWTSDPGGGTFSGNFVTLYTDTGGGDHSAEIVYIDGSGPGAEWAIASFVGGTTGDASAGTPIDAAFWHTIEIHYVRNSLVELFIDSASVVSGTAPDEAFIRLTVGQDAEEPLDPDAFAYIDNVKIGTTRGASDLFADDFDSGDLPAWDATVGEVSVIPDPTFGETISSPVGLCIAFDSPTLQARPDWTRLDDPEGYRLVTRYEISRGRQNELDKTGTGTATIDLIDLDGTLDPTNAGSPFAGKLDPMKQAAIALRDPVTDSWHTIFRGFVSDWFYDVDVSGRFSSVRLELADAFDLLAALEMTPGNHGDTAPAQSEGDIYFKKTVGPPPGPKQRVTKILDDAGWPDDLRFTLTGNVQLQGTVYARRDQALSALFDTADAEFPGVGNVYVDKIGRVSFRGRYSRFDPEDPDWEIDFYSAGGRPQADADPDNVAPITGLSFRRSKQDVINAALALPQGVDDSDVPGSLVLDTDSIDDFGWRSTTFENLLTFSGRESPHATTFPVNAVDETKLFAQYYVDNYAQPTTRVDKISFRSRGVENPWAAALWAILTKIDIGDVIHLTTTHVGGGGFDEDYFVEGLHYVVEPKTEEDSGDGFPDVSLDLDVTPRSLYAISPFTTS